MKYAILKEQEQKKYSDLMDECHVFWAFSNEQFAEGKAKHPIAEGEKYTSIGAGGYLPSKCVPRFTKGMLEIEQWAKAARKDATEVILYELGNYECFYTGDIEDAMPRLGGLGYTEKEVKAVYRKYRDQYADGVAIN